MSMTRQLWLSILVSMFIALAASLLASLFNARSYLESQLALKNRDNAAALALALSQGQADRQRVVATATALFDSGQYELVRVVDAQGRILVDKVARPEMTGAPTWFVGLLPIRSLPGQADVSSGWQPLGQVILMSRGDFAYQSLWRTALIMAGVILAAGLLGGLLASLVLRRIASPLAAVVEQARAINEHRYITMPEPRVPELRALAQAMNDTVTRLRQDFEADARRYEELRQEANCDPLTGLSNRGHFIASLDSALDVNGSPYGYLAILRLRQLGKINRRLGRQVADDVLRRMGDRVGRVAERCAGSLAGHLNGADFALLLPAACEPRPLLEELLADAGELLAGETEEYNTLYLGYGAFAAGDNAARLLSRVDAVLAAADVQGGSGLLEAPSGRVPAQEGAEDWRAMLDQALSTPGDLKLAQYPLRVGDGTARHRECPLRLRHAGTGEWLAAGRFLPLADRLGRMPALDLAALRLALAALAEDDSLDGLWLNIAGKSVADPGFHGKLLDLLTQSPQLGRRLWLEVPEAGGLARLESLRGLCRELKPLGCKLGLEHFGHQFSQVGRLYDLGLDFLKVDGSFIHDLDRHTGNQAFLAGLVEIAHRIGMQVYAEGVEREEELLMVERLGFDGASGLGVR